MACVITASKGIQSAVRRLTPLLQGTKRLGSIEPDRVIPDSYLNLFGGVREVGMRRRERREREREGGEGEREGKRGEREGKRERERGKERERERERGRVG